MLWWCADNAVRTTLLAGLVILLCRFGRFRPAVRHALWLLVLLRFPSPPLLPWPWKMTPAPELAPMADRAPSLHRKNTSFSLCRNPKALPRI